MYTEKLLNVELFDWDGWDDYSEDTFGEWLDYLDKELHKSFE